MDFGEDCAPRVISMKNVMLAFALHVAVFLLLWMFSVFHFKDKETIIPIELVFEAPPDEVAPDDSTPEPEPPKPVVKPPEPPPAVDEKVDAVVKIKDEKKPEEKKKPEPPKEKPKPEPEKPKEPPKSEKPKKTKEELKKEREERLRKMREGAKVVKNPKSPPVAGTGTKLDPNWKKLLAQGYKPSDHTELAANEEQRCYSLIKSAFYDKWDRPPWTDTLREMVLRVWFGPGGRVVNYKLEKSSGDPKADLTVINAAKTVRIVSGLSAEFISSKKSAGVPIRFKVTPQ